MLEPFGDFVVCTSDDFCGNLCDIAAALNEYSWSGIGAEWGVFETYCGTRLMANLSGTVGIFAFPTLFPEHLKGVYVEGDDGNAIFIENPSEDDLDNSYESVEEIVPLSEIAKKLSPLVEKGNLNISCWITEDYRGLCLEQLTIFSDGTAERSRVVSGSRCSYKNVNEAV